MKKNSLNVSVFLEVYNEEHRIESCLKCFLWAKELIVFDKNSTDKTVEIARKYATQVIQVPQTLASENAELWLKYLNCEWVLAITASSLIHPKVVYEIEKYITDSNFKYDVIGLPYGMYAFGINSEHSAWYTKYKYSLIRRTQFKLSKELHREIGFNSDKIFQIPILDDKAVFYHLTHENLSTFFDRISRYARYEANWIYEQNKGQNKNQVLRASFKSLVKACLILIFKRRFFLLGLDGCVLALAYLFNLTCNTLFLWERYRENNSGLQIYQSIRHEITEIWKKEF